MDIADLIREATQARERLLDRIRPLSSAQGAFKPYADEWSIAENVEHLVLAEQGSMRFHLDLHRGQIEGVMRAAGFPK